MTDDDKMADTALEAMFEDARATQPAVPEALMARVLADAQAVQPAPERGRWRVWFSTLGGVQGVGGLITASCVGFWLGVAPPQGLPDFAGNVLGIENSLDEDWDEDLDGGAVTAFVWDIEEG